jgi:isoleucyl-tRNA synthetase
MRSLLIVSQLQFVAQELLIDPRESEAIPGLFISVAKAKGQKCNRCWIYSPTVGENAEHPTICVRCAETVVQTT